MRSDKRSRAPLTKNRYVYRVVNSKRSGATAGTKSGEKEGGVNLHTFVPEIKGIVVGRETRRGGEGRGAQMEGDVTYR